MLHHSEMHAAQGQTGSTKPWASLKLRFHHGLKVEFSRDRVQCEPERDPSTSVLSHGSSRGWPRWRGEDTAHVPVEPQSCSAHWHSPTSSSQTGSHIPDLLQLDSQNQPWVCRAFTASQIISQGVGPVQHGHWGQCCLGGAEPPESGLISTSSSFTSNTFFPTFVFVSVFVVFLSSPHLCFIHHLLFWSAILSAPWHHSSHCTHVGTTRAEKKKKQDKKKKPLQITPTDAKSITMEGLNGHMVANRKKCCSINWLVIKLKHVSDKGKYKHQC